MSSVRARPVLIALLAILAVALAAATLNSAVATTEGFGAGGGGGGAGGGPIPAGEGEGSFIPLGPPAEGFGGLDLPCYRFLNDPTFLAGLAAVVLGICYGLYRKGGIFLPMGFLFAVGPPWMFVYVIFTTCERTGGAPASAGTAGGRPANNSSFLAGELLGGGQGGGTPVASVFLLAILGVALVAAVALLFRSTGDDVVDGGPEEVEPSAAQVAAIGRAAGRAADRIEDDVDADNAVYQAWREMTGYLDVERPETSTPAEFAAAAVEAGMVREDVSELTALFEEVRYGGAEPTEEREERALSALRRIEGEYADAEADE